MAWTKQSTGWLNTSSIRVLLVFNDSPLLIIQASGITEEKIFSALYKRPSFRTGGPLCDVHTPRLESHICIVFVDQLIPDLNSLPLTMNPSDYLLLQGASGAPAM